MNPPIRSRMWAAGVAFGLGFVLANYGILAVARPDHIVWLVAAVIMMTTGVLGVLFADSPRSFSLWAIIGLEILIGFTLVPLAWLLSMAVAPTTFDRSTLLPSDPTGEHFADVMSSATVRGAALDTLMVAAAASIIALVLGGMAAYALVTAELRGRPIAYGFVLAAMFLPLITVVGPIAEQSLAFGVDGSRGVLTFAYLTLTLPLAIWLLTRLFRAVPWSLRDAARADGATAMQSVRSIWLPLVAPGVLAVTGMVFFTAWNFLLFGLALGAPAGGSSGARTVPGSLAAIGQEFAIPSSAMAATTLLWFVPVLLVVVTFQRRIVMILAGGKA